MIKQKPQWNKKRAYSVLAVFLVIVLLAGLLIYLNARVNPNDVSGLTDAEAQEVFLLSEKLMSEAQENGDYALLEAAINARTSYLGKHGVEDLRVIATISEEAVKTHMKSVAQAMLDNRNMSTDEYDDLSMSTIMLQELCSLWYSAAKIAATYKWPVGITGFVIEGLSNTNGEFAFSVQASQYIVMPVIKKASTFTVTTVVAYNGGQINLYRSLTTAGDLEKKPEEMHLVDDRWKKVSAWGIGMQSDNESIKGFKSFPMNAGGLYGIMYMEKYGLIGLAEECDFPFMGDLADAIEKAAGEWAADTNTTLAQQQARAFLLGQPIPEPSNIDPVASTSAYEEAKDEVKAILPDIANANCDVDSMIRNAYKQHSGYYQ